MDSPEKEVIRLSDHIVAYVDVMGQKEKLDRLRSLPASQEDMKDFQDIAHQTYHAVESLRSGLRENTPIGHAVACACIDNLRDITEYERAQRRSLIEYKYHFSFFSDSIAVSLPYRNDGGEPLIPHVFTLFVSLSAMMMTSISNRTPVRGAIEVGRGFEWAEGGVYGPVMGDVYDLENKIAWYPRIVVGPELGRCISDWDRKASEGDGFYLGYKELIEPCKDMICADRDGVQVLDYLGPVLFALAGSIPQMKEHVESGFHFITGEYDRLRNTKDAQKSQMALRYFLLREYYSERLRPWVR